MNSTCFSHSDVGREWMNSSNIVSLFEKHGVPKRFDHMTIDIDLNTFWVLQVREVGGGTSELPIEQ